MLSASQVQHQIRKLKMCVILRPSNEVKQVVRQVEGNAS